MGADEREAEREDPVPGATDSPVVDRATRFEWRIAGGIVLLCVAAYLPAIRGDFVVSDDTVLSRNPRLDDVDGLRRIWFSTESEQYQPLVYTSYWLERRIWGLQPSGYHLVNIALHAANSVLVFVLLGRIGVRGAAVAAMLFAVHPVNVESVAWVYERKNVLSGLFYFLTFMAIFRFEEHGRWRWYAIALLLFAGALLAKASTVMLPAVLLLYWWWRRSPWRWRNLVASVPFFVLAALMATLTVWYEKHHTGAMGVEYAAGFAERFARAGWIVAFYAGKCLVPLNLMFVYPRWSADPSALWSYLPHAVMVAVLVVLLARRRTWGRPVLLGLGVYCLSLFPVLGFFDVYYHRFSFVADHFQYLATVGLIGLCVHGAACGLERLKRVRSGRRELALAVVGICWYLTWQQTQIYQNTRTLCEDTLRRNPDAWAAHYKLGEHLLREQHRDSEQVRLALRHFEQALELRPEHGQVLAGAGAALQLLQRNEEALAYYRRAVAADPDSWIFRLNLGALLQQQGDLVEAIAQYEAAARAQPRLAAVQIRLGHALVTAGRVEKGISHLEEAVKLSPSDPEAAGMLEAAKRLRPTPAPAPGTKGP